MLGTLSSQKSPFIAPRTPGLKKEKKKLNPKGLNLKELMGLYQGFKENLGVSEPPTLFEPSKNNGCNPTFKENPQIKKRSRKKRARN